MAPIATGPVPLARLATHRYSVPYLTRTPTALEPVMETARVTLRPPLVITPRLMPGAPVGDGHLSIGYSDRPGDGGRTRYQYAIDATDPDGGEALEYEAHDLQSGASGGDLQEGLSALLSFLTSAAESVDYERRTGRAPVDGHSFPSWVAEWAYFNLDELEGLAIELEDATLIEEGF